MADCVECGAELEVPRRVSLGDLLECPECEVMLEVIDVDPLTLEVTAEAEDGEDDPPVTGDLEDDEDWLQ